MPRNKKDTTDPLLPPLDSPRLANGKRSPTVKQKKFIEKYIETNNATESAVVAYDTKDRHVAQTIGSENLSKPVIRVEIERLMQKNGISMADVISIHRRNMLQNEHLPTSQKAVSDFYDVVGMKSNDKPTSETKIAFIIEK